MQSLITTVFIATICLYIINFTLLKDWVSRVVWASAIGLFLYLIYPWAIEQSYSSFQEDVSNVKLINDFVVILVIEGVGGILLSIVLIGKHYKQKVHKAFSHLQYIPGIIVFPALFYLESYLFLHLPYNNFALQAFLIALAVPLVLTLLSLLLKLIISEIDLRLELKFIVHIIQLVLGGVLSVKVLSIPVKSIDNEIYLIQLLLFVLGLICFVMIGALIYNYRLNKKIKEQKRTFKWTR